MTEPPESPVERIQVEHENGEVRYLEGDDARIWFNWVVNSINFTRKHGGQPPNLEWEDG